MKIQTQTVGYYADWDNKTDEDRNAINLDISENLGLARQAFGEDSEEAIKEMYNQEFTSKTAFHFGDGNIEAIS